MHHIVCQFLDIYYALTHSNAICHWFCVLCFVFVFIFLPILGAMVRKTRAKKKLPPPPLVILIGLDFSLSLIMMPMRS